MTRTDWTLMRHIARPAITATLLLGLAGGFASQVSAQDGPPPLPEGCAVIATDLFGPRNILLAEDGTLYITETGTGGDMPLTQPETGAAEVATPEGDAAAATPAGEDAATPAGEEATPAEGEEGARPPSTRGYTGQVTAIAPDGTQSVLADGFASYSDGIGPGGITELDGSLYMVVGGAGYSTVGDQIDGENVVYRIDPATGEATEIADLGQYEIDNNPDGQDVNPNMYAIAAGPDGMLYVADAGGNTVYSVDPESGEFELFVAFPTLDVLMGDESAATPAADAGEAGGPRQVVPTDLTFNADGQLVVSFLSEGWPADAPSIVTVDEDGTITPVANGLSAVVSIEYGPDGSLYAVQLSDDFANFAPGSVIRIGEDGTAEPVVPGLMVPHGLAFAEDGTVYAGTVALAMGPGMVGEVISCEGIAPAQ